MIELVRKQISASKAGIVFDKEIDTMYGDTLIIDIRGVSPFSIYVEGRQAESQTFNRISLVDASNMSTVTSISSDGIYSANINGLKAVQLSISSFTGEINFTCKIGISNFC